MAEPFETDARLPSAVPVFDMVVFGGTGDLAMRKLLPALLHREIDGQLPEGSRILGLARSQLRQADYVARAKECCRRELGQQGQEHLGNLGGGLRGRGSRWAADHRYREREAS